MLNVHHNPAHVDWTRRTIDLLKIGGVWAIPMWPGCIVTRTGETTVRIAYGVLPPDSDDMQTLRSYIMAAGFTVEDNE